MPRAVRALKRKQNLIDLDRRSYMYETRLLKYTQRGFAVAVPGLRRCDVDPRVFSQQFHEVKGLARLLLLEHKLMKERNLSQGTAIEFVQAARFNGGGCGRGLGTRCTVAAPTYCLLMLLPD